MPCNEESGKSGGHPESHPAICLHNIAAASDAGTAQAGCSHPSCNEPAAASLSKCHTYNPPSQGCHDSMRLSTSTDKFQSEHEGQMLTTRQELRDRGPPLRLPPPARRKGNIPSAPTGRLGQLGQHQPVTISASRETVTKDIDMDLR